MGSNDHYPVPDPKPKHKYANPEEAKKAEVWEAPLRELSVRVAVLESNGHDDFDATSELQDKLKTTIKAVEKLAKGKSLGALGLPAEEDWK